MSLLDLFRSKKAIPTVHARKPKQRFVKLALEPLEDRVVPSTFFWDPPASTNTLWNNLQNWDLNKLGSGMHPTSLPTASDNVFFDGSTAQSNMNCTVNIPTAAGVILLQNGYNAAISITDGNELSMSAFVDDTPSKDLFWVNTNTTGKLLVPGGNQANDDFHSFRFDGTGTFEVDGGHIDMGGHGADTTQAGATGGAKLDVAEGGVVNIGPLAAGNAAFKVSWYGPITVSAQLGFYADTVDATLLDNADQSGAILTITSPGIVTLNGKAGAQTTTIAMPIDITSGRLIADLGGNWGFTHNFGNDPTRSGNIYNEFGQLELGGGVTLVFADDQSRPGGYVCVVSQFNAADTQIVDNTTCTLLNPVGDTSTIMDLEFTSHVGFGTLQYSGTVRLEGTISMRISNNTNSCDSFLPIGESERALASNLSIGDATLNITSPGGAVSGTRDWVMVQPAQNSIITTNEMTGGWKTVNLPNNTRVDNSHVNDMNAYWQLLSP